MTKLPSIEGQDILRALKKAGWTEKSQKGSHLKLIHALFRHFIIIPMHKGKTVPKGTLSNIIKDSGLSVDQFIELLK